MSASLLQFCLWSRSWSRYWTTGLSLGFGLGFILVKLAFFNIGTLLPAVSITCAALRTSSRFVSMSIRDLAMSACIVPCSAKCLPNATRLCTYSSNNYSLAVAVLVVIVVAAVVVVVVVVQDLAMSTCIMPCSDRCLPDITRLRACSSNNYSVIEVERLVLY